MGKETIKNRKGSVRFSRNILGSMREDMMKAVFSAIYPMDIVSVSVCDINDGLVYYAYSPLFAEIKEGELIPEYTIAIDTSGDEIIVTAERY